MKKSLLALAIVAAAATTSVNATVIYDKDGTSIDAYGRVMAVFYSQDYGNGGTAANDGNLNSSSRLGFNFRSEINQYVAAVANVEWEMAAEDGTTSNRYTWVGADFGQFGLLKVGKFEDAVKPVVEPTDIFEDAGCNGLNDNDDRRSGMIMYSWSGYGVDVAATFGTAKDDQQVDGAFWADGDSWKSSFNTDTNEWEEERSADAELVDIKSFYAFSLGYTSPSVLFGPISVRAGFGGAQFQDTDDGDAGNGEGDAYLQNQYDKYTQWAVSASWGTLEDGLYLAAAFQTRNFEATKNGFGESYQGNWFALCDEYDVTGAEFVIAYGFANGVTLMGGYNWMKVDYDINANVRDYIDGPTDATTSVIPVLAQWQINPSIKVWAEARFDAGTDEEYAALTNGVFPHNDENVFALGAKYTF